MAKNPISANARKVIEFLRAHEGDNFDAKTLAEALEMPTQTINGVFNGLVKKDYAERVETEVMKPAVIKLLKLTDAGKTLDLDEACRADDEDAE